MVKAEVDKPEIHLPEDPEVVLRALIPVGLRHVGVVKDVERREITLLQKSAALTHEVVGEIHVAAPAAHGLFERGGAVRVDDGELASESAFHRAVADLPLHRRPVPRQLPGHRPY